MRADIKKTMHPIGNVQTNKAFSNPWNVVRLCHKGESYRTEARNVPQLVFVVRGRVTLNMDKAAVGSDAGVETAGGRTLILHGGEMILIPARLPLQAEALEPSRLVICRFDMSLDCCNCCMARKLSPLFRKEGLGPNTPYNDRIGKLLDAVTIYLRDAEKSYLSPTTPGRHVDTEIFTQKHQELLFLLYIQFEQMTGKSLISCRDTANDKTT